MTTISTTDVEKLASLSALTLTDDEVTAMQSDLTQILDYVAQLQAVDTAGIEPTYYTHGLDTIVRADEVIDYQVSQAELLKNAPKQGGGSVIVPKVLS